MSNWYSRGPIDVPDNSQKPETVIYGPKGEALLIREPRRVGFRPPSVSEPKVPIGTTVTVTNPDPDVPDKTVHV